MSSFTGNFADFDRALASFQANNIPALYSKVLRYLALDMHGRLVRMTPRDKGVAQAGWVVSLDSASTWTPPEGAMAYASDGAAAVAALQGLEYGSEVWITNGVLWIKSLNDGHSKQAPAGYVEQAFLESASLLETA
jgi:hypothetical protein